MRYDFSDDPYYQTAKQEKAEMEERERLADETRQTEVEEMDAACKDLGRKLEDIEFTTIAIGPPTRLPACGSPPPGVILISTA